MKGKVVISPNIKRVSERLDRFGNIIDPQTKEVIKPNETVESFTPKKEEEVQPQTTNLSLKEIKTLIEQKKKELSNLEILKENKVAEIKKELEELE